jgi:hypothetical protein
MILFPLKLSWPVMFDSIMPVVVTVLTVVFLNLYLHHGETLLRREGVWLGAIWLAINLTMDFPLFTVGPMKMSYVDYVADIGLTYLVIPAVTLGMALHAASMKKGDRNEA